MKDELRKGADRVTAILREAGHQAYLAGGCVRDQLLGRTPKDYDIVTDARPDRVVDLFRRTIEVGAAFGVVKVVLSRGRDYEVATYRTEGEYSDGRRPDEVLYSDDWREDVARRDLTINALLMDPETEEILDAVGGRADLEAGVIRAVGDPERRFEEDKLRMLRAVRFAARFGFALEPATREAIQARPEGLAQVSKERIVAELEGIIRSPDPGLGFSLLAELGLLMPALPHLLDGPLLVERMGRMRSTASGLAESDRYAIAWAASIDGLDRKVADGVLRDMKLSREAIRTALRFYDVGPDLETAKESAAVPVMRLAAAEDASQIEAYSSVMFGSADAAVERLRTARADIADRPLPGRPMLTGADLKALGLKPGREFKNLLDAVDDAVLRREVFDKEQALQWVGQLLEQR